MKNLKKIIKSRLWWWILPPLLLLGVLYVWSFEIEPVHVVRHVVTVTVPKLPARLDGMKIAVASDFHFRRYMVDRGVMDQIVKIIDDEKVDMIVLPGDFANNFPELVETLPSPEISAQLRRLRAPGGVYAVTGNHDTYAMAHNDLRGTLAAGGVKLLENINIRVPLRGAYLQLAGVSDYKTGQSNIIQALQGVNKEEAVVLLSHNPELFGHWRNTADLTIAGHTHGGQISLGKLNASLLFCFDQRWRRGVYRAGESQLALTSGVGTSTVRVRFNVPPEVMIVTLKKN